MVPIFVSKKSLPSCIKIKTITSHEICLICLSKTSKKLNYIVSFCCRALSKQNSRHEVYVYIYSYKVSITCITIDGTCFQ